MLKFGANINWLFTERDFIQRFSAAHDAGFGAVEFHHPEGNDPSSVARAAADAGVEIALFNAWPGDLLEGGPGLSGVPGREAQFAHAVEQAAAFGGALGGGAVVQIGPSRVPEGVSRSACLETFSDNMRLACSALETVNCKVMIEPMNRIDLPDILIPDADTAIGVLDDISEPNLGLQFDVYHEAMNGNDPADFIRRHHDRIDHLQFSDAPGRGEPGTGKLDMAAIFALLDEVGYDRWVAAEYQPSGSSEDSLGWMKNFRPSSV